MENADSIDTCQTPRTDEICICSRPEGSLPPPPPPPPSLGIECPCQGITQGQVAFDTTFETAFCEINGDDGPNSAVLTQKGTEDSDDPNVLRAFPGGCTVEQQEPFAHHADSNLDEAQSWVCMATLIQIAAADGVACHDVSENGLLP